MLALLVALVQVVSSLADYLRLRGVISAVQAAAIKQGNDNALRIIDGAKKARKNAIDDFNVSGVLADDKDFRD